MTEIARRTTAELRARYELEPELKDVFVEGSFDQDVLQSWLRKTNQIDRIVYCIDSIDIPSDLLLRHGLSEGNKQRVIALAKELSTFPTGGAYRCVVDRDLDQWLNTFETVTGLIYTQYCSIELYFFSSDIVYEILVTTAKAKVNSWAEYFESLTNTLRYLFACRLAAREHGWALRWVPFDRSLKREESCVTLDNKDYLNRLLMANSRKSPDQAFISSIVAWKDRLDGDPRTYIMGHDFVQCLAWSVNKFRGIREFANESALERLFVLIAPRVAWADLLQ